MYQIYNYRRHRTKTNYIIICHAIDLIKKGTRIDPIVMYGTYKYTWGIWQYYWIRNVNKFALPCHYFIELLDNDYVIYNGLTDYKPSYFLEELFNCGILAEKYRQSILIVIGENFSEEPPEKRLLDHMCDKLISKLVKQYKLDFSRIKLLDECLPINWEEIIKYTDFSFDLKPIQYFNKVELKMSYNKYCLYH